MDTLNLDDYDNTRYYIKELTNDSAFDNKRDNYIKVILKPWLYFAKQNSEKGRSDREESKDILLTKYYLFKNP